jgi:hypothetical protein
MEDLRDKLTKELQVVEWDALLPHFERDAIVTVDQSLNLIEVGIAMANDNSQIVGAWLKDKLLNRPDEDQSAGWVKEKKHFQFIIVQPYVLVQEVSHLS